MFNQSSDIYYKTLGILRNRLTFLEIGRTERLPPAMDSVVIWKMALHCSIDIMAKSMDIRAKYLSLHAGSTLISSLT